KREIEVMTDCNAISFTGNFESCNLPRLKVLASNENTTFIKCEEDTIVRSPKQPDQKANHRRSVHEEGVAGFDKVSDCRKHYR
ncbi:MAG: hypothetical protein KDA77_21910, partial [Planctomycetaceae bacterium]|nr:hypothetical protein [Planctomycetaceae bacterium]